MTMTVDLEITVHEDGAKPRHWPVRWSSAPFRLEVFQDEAVRRGYADADGADVYADDVGLTGRLLVGHDTERVSVRVPRALADKARDIARRAPRAGDLGAVGIERRGGCTDRFAHAHYPMSRARVLEAAARLGLEILEHIRPSSPEVAEEMELLYHYHEQHKRLPR